MRLLAATPFLEFIEYLISRLPPEEGKAKPTDDSRSFQGLFLRLTTRDIFIELPPEDAEPGVAGKLEKSLYGTRDSPLKWAEAYTKVFIAMGYKNGFAQPL